MFKKNIIEMGRWIIAQDSFNTLKTSKGMERRVVITSCLRSGDLLKMQHIILLFINEKSLATILYLSIEGIAGVAKRKVLLFSSEDLAHTERVV